MCDCYIAWAVACFFGSTLAILACILVFLKYNLERGTGRYNHPSQIRKHQSQVIHSAPASTSLSPPPPSSQRGHLTTNIAPSTFITIQAVRTPLINQQQQQQQSSSRQVVESDDESDDGY